MKAASMVLLAFLGLGSIASSPAQAAPDAGRLRTLFFSRNYETAVILATKGYALSSMSMGTPIDDAKPAAAFAAFEEARRADPSNVNARYLPAVYLDHNKRADEALPLFREAIALSPDATSIRSGYWNAIRSRLPRMKEKGYTFPVLLDDGYVSKAGVSAFPTTWFLDREGRKAFVKIGWSEKLLEEFSWRVEALRTTGR